MAASRPVFDFHGSLQLAAHMWRFALDLSGAHQSRAAARDASLAEWKGVYADQYRTKADGEDVAANNVWRNLQMEALGVAVGMAVTVSYMNEVLYAEAIEDQQRYLNQKIAQAERERERQQNRFMEFFDDIGDGFSSFFSGSRSPYDYVRRPEPMAVPAAPNFSPPGGFLASYYRSGDTMNLHYVSYVPG